MTNYDVVKRLIGNVMPIGETRQDEINFEHLKQTCDLVSLLLDDIGRAASITSNKEFSIRRSQDFARDFLKDVGA